MPKHHDFAMTFARVYPLYVQKAERKNRTKEEVDQIICWLTGYDEAGLQQQIERENDLETFFAQAPGVKPIPSWKSRRLMLITPPLQPAARSRSSVLFGSLREVSEDA